MIFIPFILKHFPAFHCMGMGRHQNKKQYSDLDLFSSSLLVVCERIIVITICKVCDLLLIQLVFSLEYRRFISADL